MSDMLVLDYIQEYYVSTYQDTGRKFLREVGKDNNIVEILDVDRFNGFLVEILKMAVAH